MTAKSEKISKINVMGEEINSNDHKGGDNVVFGIFLVLIGGLFLLNNFGIVPWIIWNYIIGFWPIFLILAGLKSILGNNLVSRIIMGIVSLVFFAFVIVYGLYMVRSPLVDNLSPELINLINNFDNLKR